MTSPETIPSPEQGALIAEGKTKKIFEAHGMPSHAIVQYKNDITAFDNPSFTKQFETKAAYSNTTNARVFEMLNRAGIPTAFVKQLNETEFLAAKCTMVPLEVVARRYAFGSYLGRHPEFAVEGKIPHKFDDLVVEFFLKTTKGKLITSSGEVLVEGLDTEAGEEDPFIVNPDEGEWMLMHSKKTDKDPIANLHRTVSQAKVLASSGSIPELRTLMQNVFLTIERFFTTHSFTFIDLKIEFGITGDGRLVVADVIDNDSWRLRDQEWNDVSKQSFRDGGELASIEDKYRIVAKLLEKGVT